MKFRCFIRRQTEKAYLVETLESDKPFWVPISVVNEVHYHAVTTEGIEIEVEDWWADKNFPEQ